MSLPRGGPCAARTLPLTRASSSDSESEHRAPSVCSSSPANLPPALLQRRRTGRLSLPVPLGSSRRRTPAGQPLRSPGPGPAVDALRAPGRAARLSSYLETRTIRKTLLRCRGSTSSWSRGAGSRQVPPSRRARRVLPGPQRRRLPDLRWPALLWPRRPSPPKGAAGAASGARIARAGLPAALAAPLAGSLERGAASPELAAETEGTTGEASIQKV